MIRSLVLLLGLLGQTAYGLTVYNSSLSSTYDPSKVIKVGLCLPYSGWSAFVEDGGVDTLRIYLDYMVAKKNNPILSNLDDAVLNIVLFDSGGTPAETYRAVLKSQPENFIAIIGCGFSGITQPAALVWSSFGIPQCDGGMTSPIYSDKKNYPYVFRTVPSDAFQGIGYANLVKYYGWKRVAIIYSDEPYGQGLLESFNLAAKTLDIDVEAKKSFYKWANASFTGILKDIKDLDLRVILYFGNYKDLFNLIKTAIDMNMKTADYAWIASAISDVFATNDKSYISLIEGWLGMDATFTTRPQSYLDFLPYWKGRIGNYVNITNTDDLPAYSALYVSCIELLVSGYNRALLNPNITLANITSGSIKWNTPDDFYEYGQETISGPMYLDKNGDRSALYDIRNAVNGTIRIIGRVVSTTVTINNDAIFIDGTANPPSDRLNKTKFTFDLNLKNGLVVAVFILAAIGFILCLGSAYILIVYRKELKSYSPTFSLLIIFGLALAFLLSFISALVGMGSKVTISCITDTWLSYLSFVLVFGSLLVKNVRVYRIFNSPQKNMKWLSDIDLYSQLGIMLIVTIGLLVVWTMIVTGANGITGNLVMAAALYFEYQCQMPATQSFAAINATILVYHGLIIVLGLYVALNTRKVPLKFRESSFIAICTYNMCIVLVFLIPLISLLHFDLLTLFAVKSLSVLYLAYSTLLIFMVPKWKETLIYTSSKNSSKDNNNKSNAMSKIGQSQVASVYEQPVSGLKHSAASSLKQASMLSSDGSKLHIKRQTFTVFVYKPYFFGLLQSISEAELSVFTHDSGCIVVIGEYGSVSEKLTAEKDPSALKGASVFILPQCMVDPVSGSNRIILSTDDHDVEYPSFEVIFSPKNPSDAPLIMAKFGSAMSNRKSKIDSLRH